LFAVKAGAKGDITLPKEKISTKDIASSDAVRWWRLKSGPGMASAVVAGDLLYVPDGSILNCYDAQTGERVYRERLPEGHDVVASPLLFDNNLLLLDEEGDGFVVQTGREFKVLASNKLDDVFWASPAVAGDSLLLRGVDRLYCIRATGSTP
jgi:outer membrane protein assembly factor BamB